MIFLTQLAYASGEPICLGDWVRVHVPKRGIWHHGIVRRISFITAELVVVEVAHNMKATGITMTDFSDFADGQIVFLHRRPSATQVAGILARVDASMGKRYHLFNQNCEHFASFAFTGKAESVSVKSTVKAVGAFALLGFLIGLLDA
jgi:hypothetical protein